MAAVGPAAVAVADGERRDLLPTPFARCNHYYCTLPCYTAGEVAPHDRVRRALPRPGSTEQLPIANYYYMYCFVTAVCDCCFFC